MQCFLYTKVGESFCYPEVLLASVGYEVCLLYKSDETRSKHYAWAKG